METVVFLLMILVCFNFMLKQTYIRMVPMLMTASALALFTALMWPFAIEQSKRQIQEWLGNSGLMLDTSVLLSIEAVLQISFCILAAQVLSGTRMSRRAVNAYRILRYFPGILIFPTTFSLLVYAIFSFPGHSFSAVARILALLIFLSVPAGSFLIRKMIPEKEIRLELLFMTNVMIALTGIIATVNGRTAVAGVSETDWGALAGITVLLVLGTITGAFIRKAVMKRRYGSSK